METNVNEVRMKRQKYFIDPVIKISTLILNLHFFVVMKI